MLGVDASIATFLLIVCCHKRGKMLASMQANVARQTNCTGFVTFPCIHPLIWCSSLVRFVFPSNKQTNKITPQATKKLFCCQLEKLFFAVSMRLVLMRLRSSSLEHVSSHHWSTLAFGHVFFFLRRKLCHFQSISRVHGGTREFHWRQRSPMNYAAYHRAVTSLPAFRLWRGQKDGGLGVGWHALRRLRPATLNYPFCYVSGNCCQPPLS